MNFGNKKDKCRQIFLDTFLLVALNKVNAPFYISTKRFLCERVEMEQIHSPLQPLLRARQST